jgi:hypothetical protein
MTLYRMHVKRKSTSFSYSVPITRALACTYIIKDSIRTNVLSNKLVRAKRQVWAIVFAVLMYILDHCFICDEIRISRRNPRHKIILKVHRYVHRLQGQLFSNICYKYFHV